MKAAAEPLATDLFDYELPAELVAQTPTEPRDASRLLVLERATAAIAHSTFRELPAWLRPGDLLVVNRSRVAQARLRGRRVPDGRQVELLLLRRHSTGRWEALVRPGRRLPPGTRVSLGESIQADIVERTSGGGRLIDFNGSASADAELAQLGTLPLPPYIHDWRGDPERYQTVYADEVGSAAAPTAGLHFSQGLLAKLQAEGVRLSHVLVHVGLDTFRPVRSASLNEHEIHAEACWVPPATVEAVKATRASGGRVVAVGTTTVRALETAAAASPAAELRPWSGDTSLYILPGHQFRAVDALITNFHFPRSTLLALVSAFAGRELILSAYREAIGRRYRFLSFGDAMLIV